MLSILEIVGDKDTQGPCPKTEPIFRGERQLNGEGMNEF